MPAVHIAAGNSAQGSATVDGLAFRVGAPNRDRLVNRRALVTVLRTSSAWSSFSSAFHLGVSVGLTHALAALAAAERVSARYQETVYEPTRLRWLAAKDAVPHVVIEPSAMWKMSPTFWSTDHPRAMALAKDLVGDNPRTSKRDDVMRARKLIAADRHRTRAVERAARASGIGAACDESDRLYGLMVAAEDAVCAYPATNLADLEAKLAFFLKRDLAQNEGNLALVLADARRLLAQEGR